MVKDGRKLRLLSGERGHEGTRFKTELGISQKSEHSGSYCCSDTAASVTFSLWKNTPVSAGSCYSG